MICNHLRSHDMLNLAQTCKTLSNEALEALYQQHSYYAIRWACMRGTIYPLRNCLRFNIPLNQYLDVSQDRSYDYSFVANTTAVVLAMGRFDVAEYLIEKGANVNLPEGPLEDNDTFLQSSRWFPIHFALLQSQSTDRAKSAIRVLKKLLHCGAPANQQTREASPFTTTRTPLAQVMYVLLLSPSQDKLIPYPHLSVRRARRTNISLFLVVRSSNAPLEALQLLIVYGADLLTMITTRVSSSKGRDILVDILLRQGADQRFGGFGGRDWVRLKDKCALLLFSMPCEQSFNILLGSLRTILNSPPQVLEILYRAEGLRVAVGSSRQPPICDRLKAIRSGRYASTNY